MVDMDNVLTPAEVRKIVSELRRKAKRTITTRRNLIIFDLATFCGLRVSEICGLRLRDIRLGITPAIRVPAATAKGGRARTVPLTWDADTLADITDWVARRRSAGAVDGDLVLTTRSGRPLDRYGARAIYQRACRVIGRRVTIHAGRHTFASLALAARRRVEAVQAAMGHASLATTSQYVHLIAPDDAPGSLI